MSYSFRPGLLPTLATLMLAALCIKLGLWQQHKAEAKQALQAQLEQRLQESPTALPQHIDSPADWRYRRVNVSGHYDPRYQILLDNQMHGETPGYHVLTPLMPDSGGSAVLVDRGWIAAPADRSKLPQVETPDGGQQVEGYLWLPGKFYALETPAPAGGAWQPLWQSMDMARYASSVPFPVLPLVIRLDAGSAAGGFARAWPLPAERVEMHIGYAYQWYGFAVALAIIYIVVNLKKTRP